MSSQQILHLVDGGATGQANPLLPFLHRPDVNILFVDDNPGAALIHTYAAAQQAGLGSRLPVIPDQATFDAGGLATGPIFFACDGPDGQLTLIYLPTRLYNYGSRLSQNKVRYSREETWSMIANGVAVGTFNGTEGFATCLGCVTVKKGAEREGMSSPQACDAFFERYYFN